MYLKSIEVQGFKSFADKILFDFHNGITGIVGPNGSGKSNVADAVRWVLGEQSAKQLRGAKMEDVIFSGTEVRKPVSYAFVAITLDNSDKSLPIDYDEVEVTRKVYRSGESEYLINGNTCRLKDINELFYDTGIGKEGYSIIGQGQIDKILSGKPEERRELFDEAAGIVKFKKRKVAAIKKLENEHVNLTRITDILAELEKQVGPLEKQSQKAKEYLKLKDSLKNYDVNLFLLETERISNELKLASDKEAIANNNFREKQEENDAILAQYENLEQEIESINQAIDGLSKTQSDTLINKGKLEGDINVINEQINTLLVNDGHLTERINDIKNSIDNKTSELSLLEEQKENALLELMSKDKVKCEADNKLLSIQKQIEDINQSIEKNKDNIIQILSDKAATATKIQRYETMLEQIGIRRSELTGKILKGKSDEAVWDDAVSKYQKEYDDINILIDDLNKTNEDISREIQEKREESANLSAIIAKDQQRYHSDKSKLEALKNITERYDGYGNSIKKIMELKESKPGILGVIADIIKVEKKYEIAIETALGGTIQNIVTDNEATAKGLIGYLKENKYGRATFLPLSAISGKNTLAKDACMKEKGVVGIASDLVRVSFEYEELAKYLLGRVLVVDNIDNALVIAKKYKYSLRIVTIEGEQLNPGGSMTGGAFKNTSNLLGRRREIEELTSIVKQLSKTIEANQEKVRGLKSVIGELRTSLEDNGKVLRDKMVSKNTALMNLKQATDKKEEIINSYMDSKEEAVELDKQTEDIKASLEDINTMLLSLDMDKNKAQEAIASLTILLEEQKKAENDTIKINEQIHMEYASLSQKDDYMAQNISRVNADIDNLKLSLKELEDRMGQTDEEVIKKKQEIQELRESILSAKQFIEEYSIQIEDFKRQRDEKTSANKAIFEKREELSRIINDLDKEIFRLTGQIEKLQEQKDSLYNYMWNEYEITMSIALTLKDESLEDLTLIKKEIQGLKGAIKALGDVNVNAIEDYKEVSERYEFLKQHYNDLVESENSLKKIIDELDSGMRSQFTEKFEQIKTEFDKVFKELFGGGRGTIELVEDEDVLEAGIRIISQPPGKKLQNMMQLSGGEKALTAISLLFAIQNLKPSPFCLLDEIEAALDDSNVTRYAQYLHKLTEHTQFIVITHRRGTMAAADRLYGITMQEKGVSTLVSVDLIDNLEGKEA